MGLATGLAARLALGLVMGFMAWWALWLVSVKAALSAIGFWLIRDAVGDAVGTRLLGVTIGEAVVATEISIVK